MKSDVELNSGIIGRFAALHQSGKLAHAYLFIGPHDIGKTQAALDVAKIINCETEGGLFCDACPSCIKLNTGNHPDLMIVDDEEAGNIKIEKIRALLEQVKLRPFLAEKKVFIIKNTERMTVEAANAFLKTLEEPSSQSLIILTSSVPEKILDTVISRCHKIYFQSAGMGDLTAMARQDFGLNEGDSRCLAYFAQGSPKIAQELGEDNFIDRKNEWIDRFILTRPEENEIKALVADKDAAGEFLRILLSWVRDSMLIKTGVEDERIIHFSRLNDLRKFSEQRAFEDLRILNASVVTMCRQLADNLNIKLPFLIIGEQLWEK